MGKMFVFYGGKIADIISLMAKLQLLSKEMSFNPYSTLVSEGLLSYLEKNHFEQHYRNSHLDLCTNEVPWD